MPKTVGGSQVQVGPSETQEAGNFGNPKIPKCTSTVTTLKSQLSKAKDKVCRRSPLLSFLQLPNELLVKIITIAFTLEEPRRIIISRPPKTNDDIIGYDMVGLYACPHPFQLVSHKFREMTLVARKPLFAVHNSLGMVVAPGHISCDIEKDEIVILQSVLDYGTEYYVPDLLRMLLVQIYCREYLSPSQIKTIHKFPDVSKVIFIHEAYRRQYLPVGSHHLVQHGLLPWREQLIKDEIAEDSMDHQMKYPNDNRPGFVWARKSRFSQGKTPTEPFVEPMYIKMKLAKDSFKMWLYPKLHPEFGEEEVRRRAHWVATGHWSNRTICEGKSHRCKSRSRFPKLGI
ncbi:uncharacterized protein LY89DRAFT_738907 [Mollisia scopiformis]|uniref:Uncharacterized protein n=1 Tax=Mollisia scopiformis TaxID=149040 RepID=A0A194WV62_MOLSC|nr:uncharacterized protein LY89DRAFT_738907 [Mollisia scopiformis]KUJ11472.1 hypothetical protein LY89DRAFT_738907 [Mollisia scopiformis]